MDFKTKIPVVKKTLNLKTLKQTNKQNNNNNNNNNNNKLIINQENRSLYYDSINSKHRHPPPSWGIGHFFRVVFLLYSQVYLEFMLFIYMIRLWERNSLTLKALCVPINF